MLYMPERHTTLIDRHWSESEVLDQVRQIFIDVLARRENDGFWKADPAEESQVLYGKCFYTGAAGTLWGLIKISDRLGLKLPFDTKEFCAKIHSEYLKDPDTGSVDPSLFLGETGILLLLNQLTESESTKDRLRELIEKNIRNPVNEALWGCPGTMIAAAEIGEKELYQKSADYLFEQWIAAEDGCWIWNQDLYGQMRKLIGAGHGFFGNVHAMLRRQEWLPDSQRELLYSRAALTAVKSATWADGMVNWMPSFGSENTKPLMQWCHGAPGAITSFALFPKNYSSELETVLLKAGEAIWKSGPLNKGVAICHGTDGNGFAFLRLFDRTGDEMWLDRAKKFAMHSLTQKNGRSTLWTGEIGLAMFLLACVDHKPDFPTLDSF